MIKNYIKKGIFIKLIDIAILLLLGSSCLFYSFFGNRFAEINIHPPFLDFPIFIGELVLGISLILCIIKWKITFPHKIKIWHLVFILYIVFMLGKAMAGYFQYGPLALRHAAIFYYPLFAVISYYVSRSNIFIPSIRAFLFLLIIFIIRYIYVSFYLYLYTILGLILALTFRNKIIRYLSITTVLIVLPYRYFFQGARTLLLASFFAFIILAIMFLAVLNIKRIYKFLLLTFSLIGIVIIVSSLGLKGAIFSLTTPKKFIQFVKEHDNIIKEKEKTFKFKEITPRLYNSNQDPFLLQTKMKKEFFGSSEKILPKLKIQSISATDSSLSEILSSKLSKLIDLEKEPTSRNATENEKILQEKMSRELSELIELKEASIKARKDISRGPSPQITTSKPDSPLSEILSSKLSKLIDLEKESTSRNASENEKILQEKISRELLELIELKETSSKARKDSRGLSEMDIKYGTMLFRLNIIRDMIEQLLEKKPILGFDFGKPFRSKRIEILGSGYGEWSRDGWVSPHNSYMHVIYRAGLIGIILLILLVINTLKMTIIFLKSGSKIGILLITTIYFWLITAFFHITFEMPYIAICFWSSYGFILAFSHQIQAEHKIRTPLFNKQIKQKDYEK